MGIGARIKELREKYNLTQKELAAQFGLSPAAVGGWEAETKRPAYDVLIEIAKTFDVSLDWLCGLDTNKQKDIFTWTDLIKHLNAILSYKHKPWYIKINGTDDKCEVTIEAHHYAINNLMNCNDIMVDDKDAFQFSYNDFYKQEHEELGYNIEYFENPVYNFIMDYNNLKSLLKEGRIKQEIFDMWLKDQYERYNYQIWEEPQQGGTDGNNNEA